MSESGGSPKAVGSDTSESRGGGSGGDYLEQKLERSHRASVREHAAVRCLGGGNLLYDPLGVFLAGERAVSSVTGGALSTTSPNSDEGQKNILTPSVHSRAVKHRVVDDIILRECLASDSPITQVVALNPGFSTRPFRLALPNVTWFEIDAVEVLLFKRQLLRSAGASSGNAKHAPSSPFHHITRETVKEAKVVGFDLKQELGEDKKLARLKTLLVKNGFDEKKPAVFIAEDTLVGFEPWEVSALLNALPKPRGSLLVTASVPKRVVKWAKRVGEDGSSASTMRLQEVSSRWRSNLSHVRPKGWAKISSANLQHHANSYGYLTDPELHRADEERVVEYRRLRRGFLGVPGMPGNVFTPIKPKTILRKVPFASKIPLAKILVGSNHTTAPSGPPATASKGVFKPLKTFLSWLGVGGGGYLKSAIGHPKKAGAGRIAHRLDVLFGSTFGRLIVLTGFGLIGHVYGDDLQRTSVLIVSSVKKATVETIETGKELFEMHIGPTLDYKVLPFLDKNVAKKLPGDVEFKRRGNSGGGAKGKTQIKKKKPVKPAK